MSLAARHAPEESAQALAERYFALGQSAGCPPDQLKNFLQAGIILQEPQLRASAAARLCDEPDGPSAVGYGGARGGGKSHWLLAQLGADDCQRVPELKCLLLRKVGKANMEHFNDLRNRLFRALPHEFSAYRGVLTFDNGSRIVAGHFQSEKDIDAYLGLEYDVIAVEEATTLTQRKYQDISTCCRTSKPNWRPRMYSTTNPGGVGHAWYRAKFILPQMARSNPDLVGTPRRGVRCAMVGTTSTSSPYRSRKVPRTITGTTWKSSLPADCTTAPAPQCPPTIFIPARVTDNAFNNAEYKRVLEGLHGWQRRAWLDGDWDIQAGQFFTTFRRDAHVIPDFDDTRARQWFAALDYGFTHYTVVLLGCTDSDGNTFIVDEHAERLWLPQRHAAAIKAMLARHRVSLPGHQPSAINHQPLRHFVAGSDVFSRQSDGTTVAAQYQREGIRLRPANMDRVNGWAQILSLLGDPGYVQENLETLNSQPSTLNYLRPRLFIHQRCARLVETLPSLQHDPNRPEDVLKTDADEAGSGGDDAADALRYLLATKVRSVGWAVA